MKGPTIWRRPCGSARRTEKPPRSRTRGTMTRSSASQLFGSPAIGSKSFSQLMPRPPCPFPVIASEAMTGEPLHLLDGVEREARSGRIFADAQRLVIGIMMRRHGQIERRRNALKHAAGEIVSRAVARAEIAARPIGDGVAGAGIRHVFRDAAEMGANADDHQIFRLD